MMPTLSGLRPAWRTAPAWMALVGLLAAAPASASEFSVAPIRVELRAGALSETITVTNHAEAPLRVGIKLMEWTQDAKGEDVYKETTDLVYFPRQMDLPPGAQRLVRVGAKAPAGVTERTYRLFVEEQPEAAAEPGQARIAVFLRFGVPVFLPPAAPRSQPEILQPTLDHGRLSLQVKNEGNQHFRLLRLLVQDGAGFSQEITGWYSLAGSERTYSLEVPRDVCRKARTLTIAVEGEGLRADRKLDVDPARCS
ncbi:fimbrial biogenesis chaperone [Ramlibacter sp. AN1133]|uniref:fimbrial biogenesis chaperone n=1 Tax=Ramlibacter sp. AN1133 TaxID=3133429 RepID=UPI0030C0CEBB